MLYTKYRNLRSPDSPGFKPFLFVVLVQPNLHPIKGRCTMSHRLAASAPSSRKDEGTQRSSEGSSGTSTGGQKGRVLSIGRSLPGGHGRYALRSNDQGHFLYDREAGENIFLADRKPEEDGRPRFITACLGGGRREVRDTHHNDRVICWWQERPAPFI